MNQSAITPNTRLSRIITQIWVVLRSPRIIFDLAFILILESLVAWGIPQKPVNFNTPADFVVWVSNLSPFFQQNFQWIDALGLFRIFQSAWFWFPASLFSLTSLIALADIAPATWQRFRQTQNTIPHPLSHRYTESIRLDAPQDAGQATDTAPTMTALNATLTANDYRLHLSPDNNTITASRHRWRWSRPVLLLIGGLLLLFGSVIQTIWGNSDQASLVENSLPMPFINHQISLSDFQPVSANEKLSGGVLTISMEDNRIVTWQLGRWTRPT